MTIKHKTRKIHPKHKSMGAIGDWWDPATYDPTWSDQVKSAGGDWIQNGLDSIPSPYDSSPSSAPASGGGTVTPKTGFVSSVANSSSTLVVLGLIGFGVYLITKKGR